MRLVLDAACFLLFDSMATNSVPFVVDLDDRHAVELELVGGKGANLAILTQRGFNVPNAFIITTSMFQYVLDDQQTKDVLQMIETVDTDDIQALEQLSEQIRTTICKIVLPNEVVELILGHYDQLCEVTKTSNGHVAVRSSATAEDLPDNSFAGQQDTYLHVTRDNLIVKVQECWASLFTARAISYRAKSQINHQLVKLAVVVQRMICSEASGVAFTANPITGLRNEVVIDSTFGLGEALVSGLVTPDHYEILFDDDKHTSPHIRVKTIGEKSVRIIGKPDGGTETRVSEGNERETEALAEQEVIRLAQLAKKVEQSYLGIPQDLEWSFSQGTLFILQARPITTLFPIPKSSAKQSGLRCFVSFGTIQGFLEPMTPLGQSVIQTLFGELTRRAGVNTTSTTEDDTSSDPVRHPIFKSAAHRLWIDITGVLTSPLGSRVNVSMVDTGINKIIQHFKRSKSFPRKSFFSYLTTFISFGMFMFPLICRSIRNFLFPRYAKNLYNRQLDTYHQWLDRGFSEKQTFAESVEHFHRALLRLPPIIADYGGPCIIPAVISLRILQKLSDNPVDALALTRAVESNPTTEMNLNLWTLAELVRQSPSLAQAFDEKPMSYLVDLYQRKLFDSTIQQALDDFFEKYGCRGIGEIDFGHRRWSEEPERVFEQIRSYLAIDNPDRSVFKIHQQSQQSAYETLTRMENELKHPWIQRPWLNYVFARLRILFSIRESPKFHGLIQTFGKCRQVLIRQAVLAVEDDLLVQADDICFLYIDELYSLASDTDHKRSATRSTFWKSLTVQRRAEFNKQMQCKRVPLLLLSDGRTFYDATTILDDDQSSIVLKDGEYLGCPVSPGVYQGKVRIVDDPINSQLKSGEILVCTATDPAWTSLFPIVGALVLEMGGMLQHGAIVSREYGVPAVVGLANAKQIFHNGQRIEVNGSNGLIRILPDE